MAAENNNLTAFVIGAGRMGRQHISNTRKAGLNVIGVFDQDVNSLETAQREQGVEPKYLFNDFIKLCESGVPDLAVIATTTPSHCHFGAQLAKHGVKYLMIEKPLGSSIAQCEELIEQCNKYGTRVAVNYLFCFIPTVLKAKELLGSQMIGGFTSLTVNGNNSGMAMVGSHFINLFNYFSESPPVTISAWLKDPDEENPRGKRYLDSGGLAVIHSATGHRLIMDFPTDQGQGLEILACGRQGMLRIDLIEGTIRGIARKTSDQVLPLTRSNLESCDFSIELPKTDWQQASIDHMLNLLNNGEIVSPEEATQVVAVLVAAHHSNDHDHASVQVKDMDKFRNRTFSWA